MGADFKEGPRVKDPDLLRRFRLDHQYELCSMCAMRPGHHIHHRIHRSQGGGDTPDNLVWLLCGSCHDEAHGIRSIW
jgi:5-methylcytosine-specific restriction endonuclease McrA